MEHPPHLFPCDGKQGFMSLQLIANIVSHVRCTPGANARGWRAAARVRLGGNEDTTREGPRVNADLVGQWEGRGVEGRPLVREYGEARTGTWNSLSLERDALPS